MSACPDKEPMLHALLDGELDAANASALEAHLATCPGCAARLRTLESLHDRLASLPPAAAPASLKRRIAADLDREARKARRRVGPGLMAGWFSAGAIAAVAASLVVTPMVSGPSLTMQLAENHARSLQADHLVDIPTSDRHVVRPWFDGKIAYAPPPAPDLKDQGFPLVGGRLDSVDGRAVAAVVYRRGAHVINLFVMPERGGLTLPRPGASGGYAMEHWTTGGLSYWAVSDVEDEGLKAFRKAYEAKAG
jgi:anti-sigma factor RsiW